MWEPNPWQNQPDLKTHSFVLVLTFKCCAMIAQKHVGAPGWETKNFWLGWKKWNWQEMAPRGINKTQHFLHSDIGSASDGKFHDSPSFWVSLGICFCLTHQVTPFSHVSMAESQHFPKNKVLEICNLGSITAEPLMGKVKQTTQKSSRIANRSFQQIKFQNWFIWSLNLVGFVCALAIFLVWSWVHSACQISTTSSLIQIQRWYFDHECFY